MSKEISFSIAGIGFSVQGSAGTISQLESLFRAFPRPTPDAIRWQLRWDESACHYDSTARPLVIPSPEFAPSCTTILIGFLLRRSLAGMIFLHGNAVLDGEGVLTIFLGNSGAGKTTLSQIFLKDPDAVLVAEDFLIIDPLACDLHPYPRSASIRVENQPGGKIHQGVGRFHAEPVRLSKVRIVVLERPVTPFSAETDDVRTALWVSSVPDETPAIMAGAGIFDYAVGDYGSFPWLQFKEPTRDQLATVGQALLKAGALPLGTTATLDGTKVNRVPFPASPSGAVVSAAQALPAILSHEVLFGTAGGAAGRRYLDAARAFRDAVCMRVIPGGTPLETADFIRNMGV